MQGEHSYSRRYDPDGIGGEVSGSVPATFLQVYGDVEFLLDAAAASGLTRRHDGE